MVDPGSASARSSFGDRAVAEDTAVAVGSSGLGPGLSRGFNPRPPAGATGTSPLPVGGAIIRIDLPLPPSANELFVQGSKRRTKTQVYADWCAEARWRLNRQWHSAPVAGPLVVLVEFDRPHLSCDLDNRMKALLDAITTRPKRPGVIVDDKQIVMLASCWSPALGNAEPRARLAIMPAASFSLAFHHAAPGGAFALNLDERN